MPCEHSNALAHSSSKLRCPMSSRGSSRGIRFAAPRLWRLTAETFPERTSEYRPGFRSFLEFGTTVRGQDYANAHMVRECFANHFQSVFDQIDVLACPSMPFRSRPANGLADAASLSGPSPNPLLRFTGPFNLSRNPTLSQPCGDSSDGLHPSLQLVGRRLGEATLIQTGAAYERATEWHKQHPGVDPFDF